MKSKNRKFRRIEPDLLLKWGCPVHVYVAGRWNELIPEPVCQWGRPVGMNDENLVITVRDRTCLDAFRSQEKEILSRLEAIGVHVKHLVFRLGE